MKKLIFLSTVIFLTTMVQAQTDAIDEMFDRYSGKDGFTAVYISSKLFSLFAGNNTGTDESANIIKRLKSIRILSVEDSLLNNTVNFYKELSKKLDLSVYEELMTVKNGNDVTKFLIRQKGDVITDLLVVTGGPGDNSLISIKGDLDLKMISELSKSTGIDELKDLENIKKEKPRE